MELSNITFTIDGDKLNDIDLSKSASNIIEDEFRSYYLDIPGREHYKLLAYFSTLYKNSTLIDIGTYKGCSSLALAYNATNKIKSFDIGNFRALNNTTSNVEYIIDNITDTQYIDLITSSPFILLDTDHDGSFEHVFYNYLKTINWTGMLMLDDIKLNTPMIEFWNSISEEKHDISIYGHHSGTGIVIFK